jgi:hypothetical protein
MDADKIKFPHDFVREAGRRNLLGIRFPKKYGGRGLRWVDELIEVGEANKLGVSFACLVSVTFIVGEGLNVFGTDAQKEKYLKPLIAGTQWAGEALTEPTLEAALISSVPPPSLARKEIAIILPDRSDLSSARKAPISSSYLPSLTPKLVMTRSAPSSLKEIWAWR